MGDLPKREADGLTHSKPNSVDQQSEDSFPASDSPSFSPGAVGAPRGETGLANSRHGAVENAAEKSKRRRDQKTAKY